LPGESIFKYFKYYGKDYPGVSILPNGNFEYNQDKSDPFKPLCWNPTGTEGVVKVVAGDAAKDQYKLSVGLGKAHDVKLAQSLHFIMNGSYELTAMVRSSGGQEHAAIVVDGHGGEPMRINVPVSNKWKKLVIPIVGVTSNRITISIESKGSANQWLEVDDIRFFKPLPKGQKMSDAKPFADKDSPMWKLGIREPVQFTGDQKFYFFDRNVGYGDSISVLFDLTADALANTTPIARITKTGNSGWSVQTTVSGGMIFRIGSIASHKDIIAEQIYEPGKKVSVSLVFEKGNVSMYKNGQLVKTAFVGEFNTKDATAAGRVGTVGKDFEAVGDVVMQVANADKESAVMKNFRGSLQNLRIYNRIVLRQP
jgi:hypothetical protein